MSFAIAVIGWVSAGCLLAGYGLVSTGRLSGESVSFQLLNGLGALGLAVNTAYLGAWPSTALNVVWIGIGVAALVRSRRRPSYRHSVTTRRIDRRNVTSCRISEPEPAGVPIP
jgi:hypothetical protein